MWIDSHCHLTHAMIRDYASPDEMIARAHAQNVGGMVLINCRMADEFSVIRAAADSHPAVWVTLGTHPHDASNVDEKNISLDDMLARIKADSKIIGIGESGLDYYYDYSTPDDQAESFRKHIRACMVTGLPLIIHARDADEDIMRILKDEIANNPSQKLNGLMHCFSSSRWLMEEALKIGFYISASGIITFKKSQELRDIFQDVPLDRLLVETDSPFLAPEPYRGKANEPSYVVHTGTRLAYIKSVSVDDMERITTENFFRLFTRAQIL